MSDALSQAALQSSSQALSDAALSNSSQALQSYTSPISAMFWAGASGKPLAGVADYGGVVSLCVVAQVFAIPLDVQVFKRDRGGYIQLASASFVSNQLDQTFKLFIDTNANPSVFGDTVLEGSVTYSGTPPDFQDSSIHRVDTPSLTMDIVPYVRTIMRAKGWNMGAVCQDRWFSLPYAPGKTLTDTVVLDVLKMEWAMSFRNVNLFVERGFSDLVAGAQSDQIRAAIKGRIKDQVRNGVVTLPTNHGDSAPFGTKAPDLETDGQGHNFPRFNRYFVASRLYDVTAFIAADGSINVPPVDDFLAAVGTCTIRYIALGQIMRIGDGYTVLVNELGAYILDNFDFNGGQDLGYWNAKTNDVGRTSIGGGFGATAVNNASYRGWRQRNARGTDYTNFSNILSRPVNFAFPATQAELAA